MLNQGIRNGARLLPGKMFTQMGIADVLKGLVILALCGHVLAVTGARAKVATEIAVTRSDRAKTATFDFILECFENKEEQFHCLNEFVEAMGRSKKVPAMLSQLEKDLQASSNVKLQCHPIVHAIGRHAYKLSGNVGDAFNLCDQTCHSGCYHGIIERVFFNDEQIKDGLTHVSPRELAERVPTICNSDSFSTPTKPLIFQCLHGLGHAILFTIGYQLTEALKLCDTLKTSYEQDACFGGVAMENVTAFDKARRDVDRKDPLYPCSELEEKYKHACFQMQTSLMFEFGLNDVDAAMACHQAGKHRGACFTSLGRDLSNSARLARFDRPVRACEVYSEEFFKNCMQGVVYALVDTTWDASQAYPFCNALTAADNRIVCYRRTNDYLHWAYTMSEDRIRRNCNQFAAGQAELCIGQIKGHRWLRAQYHSLLNILAAIKSRIKAWIL